MAGRFSRDYPIEVLRGERIPTLQQAKRVFAKRVVYLQREIHDMALVRGGRDTSVELDELAAVAILMEVLER
jgi:hypothetical protein